MHTPNSLFQSRHSVSTLMAGYWLVMGLLTLLSGAVPEQGGDCGAWVCQWRPLWQGLLVVTALGFSFLFWSRAGD